MNWRSPVSQLKQRPAFYAGVLFFVAALAALAWALVQVNH